MILSGETINKAKYSINHANQLELDLTNYQISDIGNLAATFNYFESIDLSNNFITCISKLTYLDRLRTLILGNNRIQVICDLGQWLPNLQNLFLMDNRIKQIEQVASLAGCRRLFNLALTNNPICGKFGYREYVVRTVGSLKVLDFRKIQKHEKDKARKQSQ